MNVNVYLKSKKTGLDAKGMFDTETKQLTVLKGSVVSKRVAHSQTFRGAKSIEKQRESTVEDGVVIKDVQFKSPSTAANFVTGSSTNGWSVWKNEEGSSLKAAYAGDKK